MERIDAAAPMFAPPSGTTDRMTALTERIQLLLTLRRLGLVAPVGMVVSLGTIIGDEDDLDFPDPVKDSALDGEEEDVDFVDLPTFDGDLAALLGNELVDA